MPTVNRRSDKVAAMKPNGNAPLEDTHWFLQTHARLDQHHHIIDPTKLIFTQASTEVKVDIAVQQSNSNIYSTYLPSTTRWSIDPSLGSKEEVKKVLEEFQKCGEKEELGLTE